MKTKIWIWLENSKTWSQLDQDNPRFDWDCNGAPKGAVRFHQNKNRTSKWTYVYWGATQQEAAAKVNQYRQTEIDKLNEQIRRLQDRMVKPDPV